MRELENGRNEISEEASGFSREKEMGTVAMEVTNYSGETADLKKIACMEVYPFSFEDKNSEGNVFGRMKEFLPYWKNLGINTIWLAPVYPSPRKDMGYDIADYEAIDERFGTMEEFDSFVSEVHNLGQKVLMDLVLNHTSTEHEWFKKALAGDPKYRSFYYFTDNPQEGWHNFFDDQSAWAPVPDHEGEFYLHSFHEKQADLRWFDENGELNYELLAEFEKVIDFWTKEHNVDGFRLDVPQAIDKDFSNPERSVQTLMFGDGSQSSLVVEKLFANRSDLLTTIETFDLTDDDSIMSRYAGPGKPIQFAMNAWLAQQPESSMLEAFSESLDRTPYLMIAIQSHDTSRKDTSNEVLKALLAKNPQAVCFYHGEEIGLEDPSVEEFSDKAFFESDAQADMQLKAKIAAKEQEEGRALSQSEIAEITAGIRQGARANNRAPLSAYGGKLEEQANNPSSSYSALRSAISSWMNNSN